MIPINLPVWKTAPFVRLLVPFVAGILIQWYCQLAPLLYTLLLAVSGLVYILFFYLPLTIRYRWSSIAGVMAILMLFSLGGLITWYSDIRNDASWFGKNYVAGDVLLVTLQEPLVERANSWKAFASVEVLAKGTNTARRTPANGNVLIYFQHDMALPRKLTYGSRLVFSGQLQLVNNSGNPGSFDYRRYCLFQQDVTHQVYLKTSNFIVLPGKKTHWFRSFIFRLRERVLTIIRTNIKSPKEVGLAEALLIGYQYDVDRTLMQSYSNTGVVHVIAISGLHLGLIYWLLVLLMKPLTRKKKSRFLSLVLIIVCLWIFSILAGAQAAIVRAAVMFTFLVIGKSISKNMSMFNSLAASAFLLLCYNPFWLWNVGFQLSYAALLSIVIFSKPLYKAIYIKNRGLDQLWNLTTVSIAAQLLTTPFSVYYFHQFPVYFIITNIIAVPLSSLVLLGEIVLCAVAWMPAVAAFAGKIMHFLIWLMNSFVEYMERLPFSMWQGLNINVLQAVLLMLVIAGLGHWLLEKQKAGCWTGVLAAVLFLSLRWWSFFQAWRQHKMIVYNIPKCRAIDIFSGRKYVFWGDALLIAKSSWNSLELQRSRVLDRVSSGSLLPGSYSNRLLQLGTRRIMMIDSTVIIDGANKRITIDLLVISKNPLLYIPALAKAFDIKQVLLDGSVLSLKKINYWKRDCDSLHIPCHSTADKGAFIMEL